MSKLTLSVEDDVITRAKQYASERGVSISSMVESYLDSISRGAEPESETPVLRSLRGILKKPASIDDYQKHLSDKYTSRREMAGKNR